MRERGPSHTEALLDCEQAAYGIKAQQVVKRSSQGGAVRMQLRAWPDRPLRIELFRGPTGCAARSLLEVRRQATVVQSIYIDIGFLFSVNYARVRAVRVLDGRAIEETLRR
jgi:hypothetical protein